MFACNCNFFYIIFLLSNQWVEWKVVKIAPKKVEYHSILWPSLYMSQPDFYLSKSRAPVHKGLSYLLAEGNITFAKKLFMSMLSGGANISNQETVIQKMDQSTIH